MIIRNPICFRIVSKSYIIQKLMNGPNWRQKWFDDGSTGFRSTTNRVLNTNDFQWPFGFRHPLPIEPPPPPPPIPFTNVNCGELRLKHVGDLVELDGKVNRLRLGRFIELKDQFGSVQLVSSSTNMALSKKFESIPLDSHITIIGYVKRRPDNLINQSMETGAVEVHIEEITRIQNFHKRKSTFLPSLPINNPPKRCYTTMTSEKSTPRQDIQKSITSIEYKKFGDSSNIYQYFKNRVHTCDSLRLCDVDKIVSLVGWVDGKLNYGKFIKLCDGYGQTQIIVDNDALKEVFEKQQTDKDIVLVTGRVCARPKSNQFHMNNTGAIELYCSKVIILNPADNSNDTIIKINTSNSNSELIVEKINDFVPNPKSSIVTAVNSFTCRTHNCGELNDTHIGTKVTLCGWFEFQRMKKFFTLRDGYGQTQIIVPEKLSNDLQKIHYETIVKVNGIVLARPKGMENEKMSTGRIEVMMDSLEILNPAKNHLPMEVRNFNRSKEQLRLEYRYIDLRFADMQHNLRLRSNVLMKMREFLINKSAFVEVETPTLFGRTPGGAQEFVVPTQKPGHFYSLVQSPQQFKQLLMIGAIDRYFQIARCYRDESTRPDRQPEFTQLDIELSFTDRESIISLIEQLLQHCWPTNRHPIETPFKRMTYAEAMDKYGTDKPDTRFELTLDNVTNLLEFNDSSKIDIDDFAAYVIRLQSTDGQNKYPKNIREEVDKIHQEFSARTKSEIFVCKMNKEPTMWAAKNVGRLTEASAFKLINDLDLKMRDTFILGYGSKIEIQTLMGKVRLAVASILAQHNIIPQRCNSDNNFLWIVDFPLFARNDKNDLESVHHPFTAPHSDDVELLQTPNKHTDIRSQAYDLVLNGQEIGGGSIRIHNFTQQKQILSDILKIDISQLQHMLNALESGCPPHGGIAIGIDRLMAILCNANSIRDVIAFPKGIDGKDFLSKAPLPISDAEMKLYHLDIVNNK